MSNRPNRRSKRRNVAAMAMVDNLGDAWRLMNRCDCPVTLKPLRGLLVIEHDHVTGCEHVGRFDP